MRSSVGLRGVLSRSAPCLTQLSAASSPFFRHLSATSSTPPTAKDSAAVAPTPAAANNTATVASGAEKTAGATTDKPERKATAEKQTDWARALLPVTLVPAICFAVYSWQNWKDEEVEKRRLQQEMAAVREILKVTEEQLSMRKFKEEIAESNLARQLEAALAVQEERHNKEKQAAIKAGIAELLEPDRRKLHEQMAAERKTQAKHMEQELAAARKALEAANEKERVRLAEEAAAKLEVAKKALAQQEREALEKLTVLQEHIAELNTRFQQQEAEKALMQQVARFSSALWTLEQRVQSGQPFDAELEVCAKLAGKDSVAGKALPLLSDAAQGVYTDQELINRFRYVESAVTHAALIPPDSGLSGQLLASVTGFLLMRDHRLVDPTELPHADLARVRRAGYYFDHKDWNRALVELQALQLQDCQEVAKDMIQVLKERVRVDQALLVLRARANVLNQ